MSSKLLANLPKYLAYASGAVIALVPFHAFLTVWLSSGFGHYTALRLWKEGLLLLLFVGFIALFATRPKLRRAVRREPLILVIAGYVLFATAAGALAYSLGGVSLKAYAYGLLLDTRYLVFFGITWAASQFSDVLLRRWQRLLLVPASVVGAVAVLQSAVLPADFLKHFGYGPGTIQPTATIDQQSAYRRVLSTLRGPNPLGAYMVVVLAAVAPLIMRARKLSWKLVTVFLLAALGLVFSFSRGAWIGALISLVAGLWLAIASTAWRKYLLLAVGVGIVVFGAGVYMLRDNDRVQNVLFHTSEQSRSAKSSNAGHFSALYQGIADIVNTPWGHGTGTAGPASVYNQGQVKIAENYYVQIGQEIGLLGLIAFVAINVLVALKLWRQRAHPLALALFLSLLGITAINMLTHAWADDTLAYIWWGLAGAATALPERTNPGASD